MVEDLKLLYRRWIEDLWGGPSDQAQLERIARTLVTDDFVGHGPGQDIRGPSALAAQIAQTKAMFSAISFEIEISPLVEGDFVAARWVGRGTSEAGESRFVGNDILRARDGRFAEYWGASATA